MALTGFADSLSSALACCSAAVRLRRFAGRVCSSLGGDERLSCAVDGDDRDALGIAGSVDWCDEDMATNEAQEGVKRVQMLLRSECPCTLFFRR